MSVIEAIGRIEALNRNLARFWRTANGWAPIEAAGLLSKSRLDWQVSLSRCLRLWIRTPPDRLEDGELILAWANLGSLTEGTMKLFLSVFYHDYQKDIDGLKAARAYHHKKQAPISPDGLPLDVMRVYFKNRKLLGAELTLTWSWCSSGETQSMRTRIAQLVTMRVSGGHFQLSHNAAGGKCTATLPRRDLCSAGDLMHFSA